MGLFLCRIIKIVRHSNAQPVFNKLTKNGDLMADFNLFELGPKGRGIYVDASGRLQTNTDPNASGYVFGYGETGFPLLVDASGRLLTTGSGTGTGLTNDDRKQMDGGYEFTGGFLGKALPAQGSAPWSGVASIAYTSGHVGSGTYLQFSLDPATQVAYDNSYWTDPTPLPTSGVGVFGGAYMPAGVTQMFDFSVTNNNAQGNYVGSLDFSQCVPGDLALVRFDFNVVPQIANTTIEVGLWWQTRDENDNVTFEFDLAAEPLFYGQGSVGKTFLNRPLISAYFASQEDVNALALPYIKSDNPVIIEPLTILVTIQR